MEWLAMIQQMLLITQNLLLLHKEKWEMGKKRETIHNWK